LSHRSRLAVIEIFVLSRREMGQFVFCRDRRIHETRLRGVRNVRMDVELDVRDRPARG
jgi:hypothetical protein